MTHWVNYLPEVGRPMIKRGEAQIELSKRINELYAEIRRLEGQHESEKKELLKDVLQHWSQEEVDAAENAWSKEFSRF